MKNEECGRGGPSRIRAAGAEEVRVGERTRSRPGWTAAELRVLEGLDSPRAIQDFLDAMPYNPEPVCRSPREVLRLRRAHCMEGALVAAAAIERLGQPPLLVDLRADNDDDHLIALFREGGRWGAVAKSNTTLLRMRHPVYRTVRELAMSYFPFYFNTDGAMSMRSYSVACDLGRFDERLWRTTAADLEFIGDALGRLRHTPVVDERTARRMARAPAYLMDACFAGAVPEGLFKPARRR
jgi:hypothetical protein